MESQPVKPPPIRVSAEGIAPKPITMNEPPPSAADLARLVSLPPFQMFAAERMRNTAGKDGEDHAKDYIRAKGFGQDVVDDYLQWHAGKGYWPNETPLGSLKVKT